MPYMCIKNFKKAFISETFFFSFLFHIVYIYLKWSSKMLSYRYGRVNEFIEGLNQF